LDYVVCIVVHSNVLHDIESTMSSLMPQIILMRSSKSQRMTVMAPRLLTRKTGTVLSPLLPRLHVSSLALLCRQVHILFKFHASCYSTTAVGWQLESVEGEVNV